MLSMYSGQSEEGCEVFSLSPLLRHLGGLPYQPGEGASFTFSPDDTCLVMAYSMSCAEITEDDLAEGFLDGGGVVFPIGGLRILELRTAVARTCVLRARVEPASAIGCIVDGEAMNPRFVARSQLALALPWNLDVRVALPLPAEILLHVPAGSPR